MMEKKMKNALDDDMLDQVMGGTTDNSNYETIIVSKDDPRYKMISAGICPQYNTNTSSHGMMQTDDNINYCCKCCGIMWSLAN